MVPCMASCVVMNSPVLTNSRAAKVARMSHQGDLPAPHSCTWNRPWYSSPAQVHHTVRAMEMPRMSLRGGLQGCGWAFRCWRSWRTLG
jgi:hypothetical protein